MTARFLVLWPTPLDIDAFEDHYRRIHIPLAHTLPRLLSYTVGRDVRAIRGEGDAPYIVGELEWESLDDLRAAFQSEQGRATSADVELLSAWCPGVRSMVFEAVRTM